MPRLGRVSPNNAAAVRAAKAYTDAHRLGALSSLSTVAVPQTATGWRLWTMRPDEAVLRSPYLEIPWRSASMAARCECRRLQLGPGASRWPIGALPHRTFDLACLSGIYAFARHEHAEAEGQKITAQLEIDQRAKPAGELVEIVVAGIVELHGRIVSVAEELRGAAAVIRRLIVVEDWCAGRDAAAIAGKLRATYRVRADVAGHHPVLAAYLARLRADYAADLRQEGFEHNRRPVWC